MRAGQHADSKCLEGPGSGDWFQSTKKSFTHTRIEDTGDDMSEAVSFEPHSFTPEYVENCVTKSKIHSFSLQNL